jgi:hypothetical protein
LAKRKTRTADLQEFSAFVKMKKGETSKTKEILKKYDEDRSPHKSNRSVLSKTSKQDMKMIMRVDSVASNVQHRMKHYR